MNDKMPMSEFEEAENLLKQLKEHTLWEDEPKGFDKGIEAIEKALTQAAEMQEAIRDLRETVKRSLDSGYSSFDIDRALENTKKWSE